MKEPEICPYCNKIGYYEKGNAFKCIKCGTKAIQDGYLWYYEEHHFEKFDELKNIFDLNEWFNTGGEV